MAGTARQPGDEDLGVVPADVVDRRVVLRRPPCAAAVRRRRRSGRHSIPRPSPDTGSARMAAAPPGAPAAAAGVLRALPHHEAARGDADHPDAGRAILESRSSPAARRHRRPAARPWQVPAAAGSAAAQPAARSAAGQPACRAPSASRPPAAMPARSGGPLSARRRCRRLRRRRLLDRGRRCGAGHVPSEQLVTPPLRRRGQIGIRVEPQEGVHVLHAAAGAQPLPQRGLRHLRRRFGRIHHVDIERALGPAATPVIDQILEGARGPAEAGLRHVDQGRQLLRLRADRRCGSW